MLTCQKELFDLPEGIHYLNCATTGPNLKKAMEAGIGGIMRKSMPHLLTPNDFFTDVARTKALFAQLIHCPDPDRVALIPSVSYGMATVARNLARKPGLRAGQEIVLIYEEFPSDVYAWEEVCAEKGVVIKTVDPPTAETGDGSLQRGRRWNQHILESITTNTCLVMVPHVHWTDGTLFDLPAIRQRSREVGAWLVVDASQSMGALPFDVQVVQPDALISAGYKTMLGPYGMALSYWSETFDDGAPIENNWINRVGSDDFGSLARYQREYRPAATRYNMGEQSNFILLPMLNAAMTQLLEWGVANIQTYCGAVIADAIPALSRLGYQMEEADWRSNHLFGVRLPAGVDMATVKQSLADHHISVSVRGDSIRVSTNVWNTAADLAALVAALAAVVPAVGPVPIE